MSPEGSRFAELPLLAWLSPAFPVGAFAFSHGLESAVDAGSVRDAATLTAWLRDLFEHGSIRSDAVLVAASWQAARRADAEAWTAANELALALAPSQERRLETATTGRAFADAIRAAWPDAASPLLPERVEVAYPVAFGTAAAAQGLGLGPALESHGLAFAANLVSAAIRLGPIGQTDGQRVVAALVPDARRLAHWAARTTLDDIGGCALVSDIAALRHETLYSRLFRS